MLYNFVLDKPSGYKVFCEHETVQYIKIIKCLLNTITFHPEDDDHKEFNFNESTLIFTLQLVKI